MKQLPYGVQTTRKILHNAERWCVEQWGTRWEAIGNRSGSWCVFWAGPGRQYEEQQYQWWFETEQQQMWFTLKWIK